MADVLKEGGQVDCLFLDFKKAFQSVQPALVIEKLRHFVNPFVLRVVSDYLYQRVLFVLYNDSKNRHHVTCVA